MHVCIDYRPALREGTGVGTYAHGLLAGLVRRHPETAYSAFSASWRDRLALGPDIARARPIDARIPVRALDWLWHRHAWPPVERWTGPIDISHSPSPLMVPARAARRVITVHDCYFLREPDQVSGVVRRDYVPLVRRATTEADAILAVSQTTRDELRELLDVPEDRVHVTYNGGGETYRPVIDAAEIVRSEFGMERPFVLFAGRREPRKDLPTLLAMFEQLTTRYPDLELVLVGPEGAGWHAAWAATPPAVVARTRLLDHQTPEVLGALYTAAEFLALPSRWEGFGLTAIESMACGTPVLAARAGALPEVLGDAALWFDIGNVEEMAAAAARILDDSGLRADLAARGMKRAAMYTWNRTADLTHDLYRRIVS
jgi:glycosyltransferase involved in cell wall biosynthesis